MSEAQSSHGSLRSPSSTFAAGAAGANSPMSPASAGVAGPAFLASSLDLASDQSIPEATRLDEALVRPLQLALGEEILLPFVEEYAKLQQALQASHESEQRFVNKCKALAKQTRAHTHKLTALHAIHAQDTKRKALLASEIEKHRLTLKRVGEETREKQESVRTLRAELHALGTKLEESSNDILRSQRATVERLEGEVSKLTTVRDKDRTELTKVRSKNVDLFRQLQDLLAACSRSQQEFDGLESKLLEARALSGKELRRKAELEKHMKEIQARVAERQQSLALKKELLVKSAAEGNEVTLQLNRSHKVVEQHRLQYEELNHAARVANESLLDIQEANESLAGGLRKLQKEVEEDRTAARTAKAASETKLRALEAMREKVRLLGEETRMSEDDKLATQARLRLIQGQIAHVQFKLNTNAKAMDTCVREREVLAQNHMAKIDHIRGKEAALKIKQATLSNLRNEHQGYLQSIRNLTKMIEDLKRDKGVHESELAKRLAQKARAAEEVAQRELQITEYQSQIVINEGKLRQQQNLLEAVRSDRNTYRKTLIEQQTEMHEYKRKFHFLSTQVRQSKSEIEDKNALIVSEHGQLSHVRDEVSALEAANTRAQNELSTAEGVLRSQQAQIRKLSTIISDADEELRVQIKQYNSIVHEQRVLNQQLVKRNDELANLYEQLKLQNSILSKSAAHYQERQLVLRESEIEFERAQRTLSDVLADIGKFVDLKTTIQGLEGELLAEQLKVAALKRELEKPINVHRWRQLADTNSESYGLIRRVRTLQTQLIGKNELVAQRDQEIQSKEKLYVELRKVLARQPGAEAAEQLRVYLDQLDEKRSKLKSMKAELKLYQGKVKEHQFELQRLGQDMQLIKLAYFQKRKMQQRKQAGGGGGGGGGAGGEGQARNQAWSDAGYDDMPDILRPTEFPDIPPPDFAGLQQQQQQQQQDPPRSADTQSHFVSSGANPYLASAASAAASSNPFPPAPAAASSSAASARSRIPDSDDSGADDDVDRDFRDDEREEAMRRFEQEEEAKEQLSARQSARDARSASSSRASLRSASRQGVPRPDSANRSSVTVPSLQPSAFASAASASASAQHTHRPDSRNTARSQVGGQSQRGDANFSRFPTIGGAAQ